MAWFRRFSRFGDVHWVYGQEAGMSCGLASVMMCVFKLNKLTPGKKALTVEKDIADRHRAIEGLPNYDFNADGADPGYMATILNSFTSGTWRSHILGTNDVVTKLKSKVGTTARPGPRISVEPVILAVDWDLGGAHYVVVDDIRQSFGREYAVVNDPWDANIHFQIINDGSPFYYVAGNGGFTLDGLTKPISVQRNSKYGNTDRGMVKNWGIICRD